jgi:plastocyanin
MWIVPLLASVSGTSLSGPKTTVTLQVEVRVRAASKTLVHAKGKDSSNVVVWLKSLDTPVSKTLSLPQERPRLIQRHKTFEPHLLVVPVGATVDFPNHDPFFHNVFSVFDGKRFDLGLYESGATNSVRFDKPGVSFLFCNIHPEMSAVIVVLDTSYYGISDRGGAVTIAEVPEGSFELHVWYERSLPDDLRHLTRVVEVSAPSSNLGMIVIPENEDFTSAHKNKYGLDYAPPPPDVYVHH